MERLAIESVGGTRFVLNGPSIASRVRETNSSQRINTFDGADGAIAREAKEIGIRSSVGCPIVVAGHLWGVIAASTKRTDAFPPDTEKTLGDFAELIATAVANADSREHLAASRARVVTASDEARRRLERDLHDGAQQRLLTAAIYVREALDALPVDDSDSRRGLDKALAELADSLTELREIARGLHPPILTEGGLRPAIRALARRSSIPVEVEICSANRYESSLEMAVYCIVCEALTNAVRHAAASHAKIVLSDKGDSVVIRVCDDGVGGADPRRGSGLVGLRDRIEAFGGSMTVTSPIGAGTTIEATLPVDQGTGIKPKDCFTIDSSQAAAVVLRKRGQFN